MLSDCLLCVHDCLICVLAVLNMPMTVLYMRGGGETWPDWSAGPPAYTCPRSQFKNNCLTETCSGSEAGLYLRLMDFCASLNARLESNNEEQDLPTPQPQSSERDQIAFFSMGQLRPDSGLDSQAKVLQPLQVAPSSLGSGYRGTSLMRNRPPPPRTTIGA